jgi:hypothetical protein
VSRSKAAFEAIGAQDVSKERIAALERIGEPGVVEAEKFKHGGVQIVTCAFSRATLKSWLVVSPMLCRV